MRTLISLLSLAVCGTSLIHGQMLVVKQPGRTDSLTSYSTKTVVGYVLRSSEPIARITSVLEDTVRIIVEFASPARLEKPARAQGYELQSALEKEQIVQRIAATAPACIVTRSFSEVLNAVAVTIRQPDIDAIRLIPGVRHIYRDYPVTAFGSRAGAPPSAHPASGTTLTGTGVRIGLLDTGIDYAHEAFGGAMGGGHTVAGGYDFVNNDSDPMDDNGHGSHVAGIIAANSPTMTGIAPNAQLFAYKVLDASGNGNTSTVLAGIERAINDGVQIINLSLGSTCGDPDDALCIAVDRAVDAGVLVVAAAGNTGDYGTIGSPAAARSALTVGAVDTAGAIAPFSSRGPTYRLYGLKPDVVAPGVGILSVQHRGGYAVKSGTSMAAPHVTGLAALLREAHPDWTAQELRSAILESAVDLRLPPFMQGSGKADTTALRREVVVIPAAISFGFAQLAEQTWTASSTLRIVNHRSQSREYRLTSAGLPPGVMLRFNSARVLVPPGQTASVVVEIAVDNSIVPHAAALSTAYGGNILSCAIDDTISVPFVFFKGSVLQLAFGETPFQVFIHNGRDHVSTYNPTAPFLTAVIPEGVYDVVTSFLPGAYVLRESLDTRSMQVATIRREEAVHEVMVQPCNESGNALAPTSPANTISFMEALTYNGVGISQVILGGGPVRTASLMQRRYFSPTSSRYSFSYSMTVRFGTATSYTFDASVTGGISANRIVTYQASDLKRIEFRYDIDTSVGRAFPIEWTAFASQGSVLASTLYNSNDAPLAPPFVQVGYYSKQPSAVFPFVHYREAYKY